MKRVGVREFKDKVTSFISKEQGLVIEKHGKPVGFYVPLPKKDRAEAEKSIQKLEHTLDAILSQKGLTREAFEQAWEEAALVRK